MAAPARAGVVCDRQHRHAGVRGDRGPAGLVFAASARRNARAFGINHDPETAREPVLALREHLLECAHAGAAVDCYGRYHRESPAEKGDPQ
jgi:hypothetical protein